MQQERVDVIRPEAFQAAVQGFQNVFLRKVEHARPDADLGLEDHLLAQAGVHADGRGKFGLGLPAAVDVGMIEVVDAAVQGGVDQGRNFRVRQGRNAHAAQRNFGPGEVGVPNSDLFHVNPSFFVCVYDCRPSSRLQGKREKEI